MRNITKKKHTYKFRKLHKFDKFYCHEIRLSGKLKFNKQLPHGGNKGAANIRAYYRTLKFPELTPKEIKEYDKRKNINKLRRRKLEKIDLFGLKNSFHNKKSTRKLVKLLRWQFESKLLATKGLKFDESNNNIVSIDSKAVNHYDDYTKNDDKAFSLNHLYAKSVYNVNNEKIKFKLKSKPFFHTFSKSRKKLKLRRLGNFGLREVFYIKSRLFKDRKKLLYRRWIGRGFERRLLYLKHIRYYLRRAFRRMNSCNLNFNDYKKVFQGSIVTPSYLKSEHIKTFILKTFFGRKRFKRTSWGKLERFLKFEIYKPYRSNKLKPTDEDHLKYFINLQDQLHKFLFGGFTFKKVWKISRKLQKKRKPVTSENIFANFQCRLDSLLQNLGFSFTIEGARNIIKNKFMLINGRQTSYTAYVVKPNDVFGFIPKYRDKFRKEYLFRISRMRTNNVLLKNIPYIEKNYLLMLFTYISSKFNEKFIALPAGFRRSLLFGLNFRKI